MPDAPKKCFIAMPITTREHEADRYNDKSHWEHVMESLFVKAILAAGYEPIRPVAQGSHLIHEVIIKHLEKSDMVLCDLSGHNPNVFFELGVRTSLNKPIMLVRDEHTDIPFDTGGINTHTYKSTLHGWDMDKEQENLQRHLAECADSCHGENPLWRKFGLTLKAHEPQMSETPLEAKIDLITRRLPELEARLSAERHRSEMLQEQLRALRQENVRHPSEANTYELFERPLPKSDGNMGHFTYAVNEYAEKIGRDIEVSPVSDTLAQIRVHGKRPLDDDAVLHIQELAARCGVVLLDSLHLSSRSQRLDSVRIPKIARSERGNGGGAGH